MLIFALYKELQKADRRHEAALGIPQHPQSPVCHRNTGRQAISTAQAYKQHFKHIPISNMDNNIVNNEINNETGNGFPTRRHRRAQGRGKFFMLRNILNIIFIIGAVVGMLCYFFKNEEIGIVIVLGAMAFKMCECVIRLVK